MKSKFHKVSFFYRPQRSVRRYGLRYAFRKGKKFDFHYRPASIADNSLMKEIFLRKGYDFADLNRYQDILAKYNSILANNKIPLIVDCGANIGAVSLYFSLCFPEAIFYAIEPDEENIALLKMNTQDLNIKIFEGAISNRGGGRKLGSPC